VNATRAVRRGYRFVVHNWPLKVGAIVLATLLYAGLVASQDSSTFPGPITVTPINQPVDTVVTNQVRDVDQVRYLAPVGVPRPRPGDFRATIDLANVKPDGNPVNIPVRVIPVDPRITVIDITPRTVQVVLDTSVSKVVPVHLQRAAAPSGIEVGEEHYEPQEVTVTGASSAVTRIVAALVAVPLDPGGLDVDREIEAQPVDANGALVTGVDVEPRTVHVEIPLFTNKESRTVPVNPVVTGTPAPGFRVAAISVDPLAVTVEGDAEQLTALVQVDTAPVTIFGATADITQRVTLALPSGVFATGTNTVTVHVTVEAVTETRTYAAGLRLDGREPGLDYAPDVTSVLLTLFGPVADLDRLSAAPLVVGLNVAGLGPGTHVVTVVPVVPTGITVAAISPETVTVTVTVPAAGSAPPSPGATGSPAPSPSAGAPGASPTPSPTP